MPVNSQARSLPIDDGVARRKPRKLTRSMEQLAEQAQPAMYQAPPPRVMQANGNLNGSVNANANVVRKAPVPTPRKSRRPNLPSNGDLDMSVSVPRVSWRDLQDFQEQDSQAALRQRPPVPNARPPKAVRQDTVDDDLPSLSASSDEQTGLATPPNGLDHVQLFQKSKPTPVRASYGTDSILSEDAFSEQLDTARPLFAARAGNAAQPQQSDDDVGEQDGFYD